MTTTIYERLPFFDIEFEYHPRNTEVRVSSYPVIRETSLYLLADPNTEPSNAQFDAGIWQEHTINEAVDALGVWSIAATEWDELVRNLDQADNGDRYRFTYSELALAEYFHLLPPRIQYAVSRISSGHIDLTPYDSKEN